jgi:hypothetical protein
VKRPRCLRVGVWVGALVAIALTVGGADSQTTGGAAVGAMQHRDPATRHAEELVEQGQQIFRFDTFGDEVVWGAALQLHRAIEGAKLGGVGPGLGPKAALAAGLKVDVDALPPKLVKQLEAGKVNLHDPAVTLALLERNAVVGVTGLFDSSGKLRSVGLQCAVCHSTVDNSHPALCFGAVKPNPGTGCIGRRLDGWPNRDLNVGGIISLATDLSRVAGLLGISQADVRKVLATWGPGKFDANCSSTARPSTRSRSPTIGLPEGMCPGRA